MVEDGIDCRYILYWCSPVALGKHVRFIIEHVIVVLVVV